MDDWLAIILAVIILAVMQSAGIKLAVIRLADIKLAVMQLAVIELAVMQLAIIELAVIVSYRQFTKALAGKISPARALEN